MLWSCLGQVLVDWNTVLQYLRMWLAMSESPVMLLLSLSLMW